MMYGVHCIVSSNNTNKFNPQEPRVSVCHKHKVQIIQINSILKNDGIGTYDINEVQIIQINSILKNALSECF